VTDETPPSQGPPGPAYVLFLVVFFASGFAALVYQVLWQRLLAFFSGADVYSITIIVSAFMAGLGLGSLFGGALADRLSWKGSFWAFGLFELAIAGFGLLSVHLYYDVLYGRMSRLSERPILQALVLFLTLLWPTFFMGASLPLLARGVTSAASQAARRIGSLYAFNTLGAAIAPLLALLVLVRLYGFSRVVTIAAWTNLGCAATALLCAALLKDRGGEKAALGPADEGRGAVLPWMGLYFLAGFVALSLEIVWFRVLEVMLKSNAFTFGVLLAIYLSGVGVGSLLARGPATRSGNPEGVFFALQGGIPLYAALSVSLLVAALGSVPGLDALYSFFGSPDPFDIEAALSGLGAFLRGAPSPEDASLVPLFLTLYVALPVFLVGPPTVLMGMSFAYLQRIAQTDPGRLGRRVGLLQASNIAGCTLGVIVTGLGLLAWVGSTRIFLVLLPFSLLLAGLAFRKSLRVAGLAIGGLAVLAALLLPDPQVFWARIHGVAPRFVIAREDGSGVSVLRRKGKRTEVCVNGISISWIPFGGIHTVLGALPVFVHPSPRKIAVIGLGSGDTLFALGGSSETESIDCVEIVAPQAETLALLDAQRPYPGLKSILHDPRIRMRVGDGRKFLMGGDGGYDLIEADALLPHAAYAGNLYSAEYFALLRSRLRAGGIAVTWAPTRRTYATFRSVFPSVLSFDSGQVLLGSDAPIPFRPEVVEARIRSAQAYYEAAGLDIVGLLAPYLASATPETRGAAPDPNLDLFPKDELYVPDTRATP
jgi:spermidine synthase